MNFDCDFNNDQMTCRACGYKSPKRTARKNCVAKKHLWPIRRGLGDWVAELLADYGITAERYIWLTGQKSCGCAKRRFSLNQFGWEIEHRIKLALHWFTGHVRPAPPQSPPASPLASATPEARAPD